MTQSSRRAVAIVVVVFACASAGALAVALATRATVSSTRPTSADASHVSLNLQTVLPAAELFLAAAKASRQAPPGIVRATGTHLVLDGKPWRFVGFNDYQLTSQRYTSYTCGGEHSDTEVETDFAQMHSLGVTVVRTWFFQSYLAGRDWSAFDRVLGDAARYGIRVIPVLANQWGTCEDFNRAPIMYKALVWYRTQYRSELDYGLPLSYRDYAVRVAHHYAGDRRVAFWQLMNEAEDADSLGGVCHESDAATALRSFADDMARALKAADPVHLISLGTIGGGQCGTVGPDYSYVHSGAIDLCEGHDYSPVPQLAPRDNRCQPIHKPMFIGERGFNADVGSGSVTAVTLEARAAYVGIDISSAFAADGCEGYLLWSWSGSSASYGVAAGDPIGPVMMEASRKFASAGAVYIAVILGSAR